MTWIVEIIKLGVPAALGVIIAALLIAWIGPDGWGGMALIFVLSIAVSYLLVWSGSQMLSLFRKKPVPEPPIGAADGKPEHNHQDHD